jgi:Spy/CpxP family protein refolding chaperone
MRNRFATTLAAVGAAAVVSLSGAALAQHAMHHGPAGGGDFVHAITELKSQLNLNTSQQTMWDSVVAQGKAAMDTGRANFGKVRTAMTAELAKPEPDLAAVAAVSDDVQASNAALHKQVRASWLALYATFTPDQKAVVKQALTQRMAKMDGFRERMKERRAGKTPPA